jgi:hypothetical protein
MTNNNHSRRLFKDGDAGANHSTPRHSPNLPTLQRPNPAAPEFTCFPGGVGFSIDGDFYPQPKTARMPNVQLKEEPNHEYHQN